MKEELKTKTNEFIKLARVIPLVHAAEGGVINLDDLLIDFIKYLQIQKVIQGETIVLAFPLSVVQDPGLSFVEVETWRTEQTGGGIMNDMIHLRDGRFLVISPDMICLYKEPKDYADGSEPQKTIFLYDEADMENIKKEWNKPGVIRKAPENKYILFGKDVCATLDEGGIDDVCAMIADGAEYQAIKTDGSNLSVLLGLKEEYKVHSFISAYQYDKILCI